MPNLDFARFHNALRIMRSIDKQDFIENGGHAHGWPAFQNSPFDWFIGASDRAARNLWAYIESRQPQPPADKPSAYIRDEIIGGAHVSFTGPATVTDRHIAAAEDLTAPFTADEAAEIDADREVSALLDSCIHRTENNMTIGELRAKVRAKMREKQKQRPVVAWLSLWDDGDVIVGEGRPDMSLNDAPIARCRIVAIRRVDLTPGRYDTADTPSEWDQAIDACIKRLEHWPTPGSVNQQVKDSCIGMIADMKMAGK